MNRREFLKAAGAGTGALALGTSKAEAKKITVRTPLKTNGYLTEPAKKIPIIDNADVVVSGGGPAGVAAAIAAARQGADVLLLERQYFLGGLFTGCGVTPIIDMYSPGEKKGESIQAIKGICEEFCQKLKEAKMLNYDQIRPKADPEAAKFFLEEMIDKAGVRLLYGVQAAEVVMSGNRIDAIIIEGKSGRVAIQAKYFVDCTGDGDLLEWTGEDFTVYKDDIGAMWRIGNAENYPSASPTAIKGVKTGWMLGEKGQDGLDIYNLTRIQKNIRRKIWEQATEQRQKEGCEDLFIVDTPSVVGVRVTRVLNSMKNVTVEGAIKGFSYNDTIGFTGADSNIGYNGTTYRSRQRKIWQIPYSSLTPKRVENLLVGGRCFGYERGLTYDSREVGTCFMTGQAAGTAIGLAVKARCSCQEVNIPQLQENLRKQNVKLDW